jgi:hypothetical protein
MASDSRRGIGVSARRLEAGSPQAARAARSETKLLITGMLPVQLLIEL